MVMIRLITTILLLLLTEEKLILEKDDINKTRVAFEKWE